METQLYKKICLRRSNITELEVDAIVNAANEALAGGGGVDGAIHKAAGPLLAQECRTLNGCPTGMAKITKGYNLMAKYVIHTVGPDLTNSMSEQPETLASCYRNSLDLVAKYNLKSVAFPCISTKRFSYPNEPAANVALKTVRDWLLDHQGFAEKIEMIIFCVFLDKDERIYRDLIPKYFPSPE